LLEKKHAFIYIVILILGSIAHVCKIGGMWIILFEDGKPDPSDDFSLDFADILESLGEYQHTNKFYSIDS